MRQRGNSEKPERKEGIWKWGSNLVKHGELGQEESLILKRPNEYGSQTSFGEGQAVSGGGKGGRQIEPYYRVKEVSPWRGGKSDSLCSSWGLRGLSVSLTRQAAPPGMLGSVSGPLSISGPRSTTWPSVLCPGPGPVWRDTWEG